MSRLPSSSLFYTQTGYEMLKHHAQMLHALLLSENPIEPKNCVNWAKTSIKEWAILKAYILQKHNILPSALLIIIIMSISSLLMLFRILFLYQYQSAHTKYYFINEQQNSMQQRKNEWLHVTLLDYFNEWNALSYTLLFTICE